MYHSGEYMYTVYFLGTVCTTYEYCVLYLPYVVYVLYVKYILYVLYTVCIVCTVYIRTHVYCTYKAHIELVYMYYTGAHTHITHCCPVSLS